MNTSQILQDLEKSFLDYRLTRSEKRALDGELGKASEAERNRLRHEIFEMARSEMLSPDAVEITKWLEDTVKLLTPKTEPVEVKSEVLFSPEDNCVAKICALLMRARRSVDICVFTITDDRVASSIVAAHQRKIDVRIITDNEKSDDLGSDICHMRQLGVPVRIDETPDHMHHKYAVFDQNKILTGSYNWTRSAANRNEENLVVTNDKHLVERFTEHFDTLWRKFG